MDDNTIKEAKVIEDYLKHSPAKISDILVTVYFKLSRKPTEEERKILNEHKANLFNRLQEKGYIKYEKKRTTKNTEQRLNNEEVKYKPVLTSNKVEKLNRYRTLKN